MWLILVSLGIGILFGINPRLVNVIRNSDHRLTLIGVLSLLFVMGIKIGMEKGLINDLKQIGFSALVFAVLTVLGSVIVVYLITRIGFRGSKE